MYSDKHILVADDDDDDLFLVKSALEDSGFNGKTNYVSNGIELLDFLNKDTTEKPTLVLLDLNMPKKDGREALIELRQNPALDDLTIIIFTTSNSPDDIQKCYVNGANCYISKPNSFDELVEVLGKIMNFWGK
ncbi:MAG: response regulator [Emticicia sp.]